MLGKSEVKYIQSLSQKKFREEESLFIIEGPKIVKEALQLAPVTVKKIYALADWVAENEKYLAQTEIISVEEGDLKRISQLRTPNKVLALVEMPWSRELTLNENKLALALDCIQDPGNLGTIIRIADWFGVEQMICSKDCADIYNGKVVQASMGSLFRVEIFYTALPEWLASLEKVAIYGAALDGKDVKSMGRIQEGVLVIGNESKGISPGIMKQVTEKITIERLGKAESLNAAVATGIILSHLS